MIDDDVQPVTIAARPGIRYEACWGRKTFKAATFIARVYEWVDGGGMELWHCNHKHPDKAAAQDCACDWTEQHVARQQATAPGPAADLARCANPSRPPSACRSSSGDHRRPGPAPFGRRGQRRGYDQHHQGVITGMTSRYQRGNRVVLVATTDPHTRLVPGTLGTITGTDDQHGQIHIAWDDGSTLSMLPGDGDQIRLITQPGDRPQ
jgi:hypothetical protein